MAETIKPGERLDLDPDTLASLHTPEEMVKIQRLRAKHDLQQKIDYLRQKLESTKEIKRQISMSLDVDQIVGDEDINKYNGLFNYLETYCSDFLNIVAKNKDMFLAFGSIYSSTNKITHNYSVINSSGETDPSLYPITKSTSYISMPNISKIFDDYYMSKGYPSVTESIPCRTNFGHMSQYVLIPFNNSKVITFPSTPVLRSIYDENNFIVMVAHNINYLSKIKPSKLYPKFYKDFTTRYKEINGSHDTEDNPFRLVTDTLFDYIGQYKEVKPFEVLKNYKQTIINALVGKYSADVNKEIIYKNYKEDIDNIRNAVKNRMDKSLDSTIRKSSKFGFNNLKKTGSHNEVLLFGSAVAMNTNSVGFRLLQARYNYGNHLDFS